MKPKRKPRKRQPKTAAAVYPNAGVEAWYKKCLQAAVCQMAKSMLYHTRASWKSADPEIGFAQDSAPLLAAGIMFRLPDNRVLLCRRTDGVGPWAFPGGGVELNETPEAAARREVAEEIGWSGVQRAIPYDVQPFGAFDFHTFAIDVSEPFDPRLNEEHDGFVWVTPAGALTHLSLHPGVRATLSGNDIAQDAANPSLILRKALTKWGNLWVRKFNRLSHETAAKFADKNFKATQASMDAAFKQAGFTIPFKPTRASMTAYRAVIAENVGLIKSIPQKFLSEVQGAVWDSVRAGGDLASLSDTIEAKYGITARRAAGIARDQNNKAKAVIENVRRQEAGVLAAIWQHSHAGKEPRPTHVAMHGQKYDLAKGMWDSAERKWIWPGQLINCRCVSKSIIPGLENLPEFKADYPEPDPTATP